RPREEKGRFTVATRRHHEKVPAPPSPKPPASPKLRLLARSLVPLVTVLTVIGLVAAPASANRRQDAMAWALRQIGCPYTYGGTGPCPRGFDCSRPGVAPHAHGRRGLP